MKGKKVVLVVFLSLLITLGSFGVAMADTILFPVIAVNQPNVTTIISVWHEDATPSTHLRYIYRYKDSIVSSAPNHTGTCGSISFTRSTSANDLVSFDVSGVFNTGNALFNDTDTYGGAFNMAGSGARRAYLLVATSDSLGNHVVCGATFCLGGEFGILDIAYGAMWGGKAINDKNSETYTFTNADDAGGGVWSAMPANGNVARRFSFFPTNEWTTKFFITPIGANMDTANLSTTVDLYSDEVYDRNGTEYNFASAIEPSLTCTTAMNVTELMDSTSKAAVETTGGWGLFHVKSSDDAIVYKLEYVVENSTYGGTNNNAFLLSTFDLP